MYEQFFHFKQRPFLATPCARNYVATEVAETAREQLLRAILRGEGPGLLIGPPGTGKTLLLHVLAEQCRSHCDLVMLPHGRFPSPRALLQTLLHELKQPFHGLEDAELRIALMDYIKDEGSRPVVVLADEADTLKLRILEELRVLTNVQRKSEPAVRLVLAGSPALEERLTSPKLQTLNQRIAVRCYLDALNRADTFNYVRSQVSRAGAKADQLFPEDALQAVYHATGGVPRLINQVCDHALVLAYADGVQEVTAELVQEAWSDLQQIPVPWNPAGNPVTNAKGVIEFGSLTEEAPSEDVFSTYGTGDKGTSAGNTRFGFLEKPESDVLASPHLEETGLSSETSRDGAQGAEEFDVVPLNYPTAAPELSTTSVGQESPLGDRPDPLTRIEQIDQAVQSLQEENLGQAPKKPEAEIVFYDWGDPFEETFLQEIPVRSGVRLGDVEGVEDHDCGSESQPKPTTEVTENAASWADAPSPSLTQNDNNLGLVSQSEIGSTDDVQAPDNQAAVPCSSTAPDTQENPPTPEAENASPQLPATEVADSPSGENSRDLSETLQRAEGEEETNSGEDCEVTERLTLQFSLDMVPDKPSSSKAHKHRAIMKSLFTRLRKSG